MKKLLIQRLAQLIDNLPRGVKRTNVMNDYLSLKLSKDDKFYLTMADKYKNYEQQDIHIRRDKL